MNRMGHHQPSTALDKTGERKPLMFHKSADLLQVGSGKMTFRLWRTPTISRRTLTPSPCHHWNGLQRPGRRTALCPTPAWSSPTSLSQTWSCEVKRWVTHTCMWHNLWSKQLPCLQPKATSLSPWPRVTSTLVFLSDSQP